MRNRRHICLRTGSRFLQGRAVPIAYPAGRVLSPMNAIVIDDEYNEEEEDETPFYLIYERTTQRLHRLYRSHRYIRLD